MAVPAFLDEQFHYTRMPAVTDMADVITRFRADAAGMSWSEPSGGLFKSPVDADGRWFDILLTRISATNLECRMRTATAVTVYTGRMQIDAAGDDVIILLGQHYFWICSLKATGGWEWLNGGIFDLSPESQTIYDKYYYGFPLRTTGDAFQGYTDASRSFVWTGSAYGLAEAMWHNWTTRNLSIALWSMTTGAAIFQPVNGCIQGYYAGRLYNHMFGPSSIANGSIVDVPIDDGVTGKFLAMGVGLSTCKLYVRCG